VIGKVKLEKKNDLILNLKVNKMKRWYIILWGLICLSSVYYTLFSTYRLNMLVGFNEYSIISILVCMPLILIIIYSFELIFKNKLTEIKGDQN